MLGLSGIERKDRTIGRGRNGRISALWLAASIFFAGLVFVVQPVCSQTFTEFDLKTYQLYLERRWDELIQEGRKALKQDMDYYYMRMRIGIAFYEKKNYKSAQSHFRKALEFNDGDAAASEYLYYAYLLGGQTQQAALLYEGFPPSLKEKVSAPGLKPIDKISIEYLYNLTFSDDLIDDPGTFEGLPYGVQIITRDFQNLNLSMRHFMHPGISFTHAYTYLGKSSYYYYDDGSIQTGVGGHKVNQHQYYLSPLFTTYGGLVISPSFHFLHVIYQTPDLTTGGFGPGAGNNSAFTEEFENQLVGGLTLAKYQGPFYFRIGTVYSNLNRTSQLTGSAGMTWYPMGNPDLYLAGSLHVHTGDLEAIGAGEGSTEQTDGGLALIPDLLVGRGIASRVWIELSGSYGDMRNFTGSNGYIVYNGLDWMKYMALATLTVPLTRKGSIIYAGARFAGHQNRFIPMDITQPGTLNNLSYNSLSIFGGISWKF